MSRPEVFTQHGYTNPMTGEVIKGDDIEGLMAELAAVKKQLSDLKDFKLLIEAQLADETPRQARTEHILRGKWKASITHPQPGWDKPTLKEVWQSASDNPYREKLLRIDSVAVNMREWNMAVRTKGDEDFASLVLAIEGARTDPSGNPKVELKRLSGAASI